MPTSPQNPSENPDAIINHYKGSNGDEYDTNKVNRANAYALVMSAKVGSELLKAQIVTAKIFGKMCIVSSAAGTAAVAGLLEAMATRQNEIAKLALDTHLISEETYEAYLEFNRELINVMHTENIVGQGPAALATGILLELHTRDAFKKFSDEHHLPSVVHDALSMSIIPTDSFAEELDNSLQDALLDNSDPLPPELEALAKAKEALITATEIASKPPRKYDFNMEQILTDEEEAEIISQNSENKNNALLGYLQELYKVMENPDTAIMLMDRIDPDDTFELAFNFAIHNNDISGMDPRWQELKDLKDRSSRGGSRNPERIAAQQAYTKLKQELKEDPEACKQAIILNINGEAAGPQEPIFDVAENAPAEQKLKSSGIEQEQHVKVSSTDPDKMLPQSVNRDIVIEVAANGNERSMSQTDLDVNANQQPALNNNTISMS